MADYVQMESFDPNDPPQQPNNENANDDNNDTTDDYVDVEIEQQAQPDSVEAKQDESPAEASSPAVAPEESQPEPEPPAATSHEIALPEEPALIMPSTSDPAQDEMTEAQIIVEQHEPLIGSQETFTDEVLGDEEYKETKPRVDSLGSSLGSPSAHNLSVDRASELTESKRRLLEEEDGQVIRFGNFDVSYKKPREIFCSTNITLLAVNLREQTFDVEMDMRFFWLQPEIEEAVPQEATWSIYDDGKSLPVDPDDFFEYDQGLDWIQQEFHYHHDTKVVEWQCQFRDTFAERMELRRFPVDRQFLNILLQGRVKPKEGNWIWVAEPPAWVPPTRFYVLRSRLGQSISDYELFAPWADFRVIHDDDLEDNQIDEQPPFKLRLRVQRYTSYYLGNINIPMFLIVAVCLVSLVMPPDNNDLANRLSVTVTSMLAGVAFRFVVSEMLPPVNYLTWMDYYVGVSFFMVSMFILENALATIAHDTNESGGIVDFYFGGALMVMWVVINVFFAYACLTNTFRLSWQEMDIKDRMPSELDTFQPSPPDQTQGTDPKDPMDTNLIQMAMLRQLTSQ